ncbi:MAG: XTP/dITP diphosphatase [Caldilinea sp.]
MMNKVTLLVATHNIGKVREYAQLLADLPVTVTWLDDVGITEAVDEVGATFAENALLKARHYAEQAQMLTWADDSGLEVDALGGRPGVYSARYGGEGLSDSRRYETLLRELDGVPDGQRTARFRCVVAIAQPDGQAWTAEGAVEGTILYAPRGSSGFGYDPVFFVAAYDASMAELSAEVKNQISHRAIASINARQILARLLD